MDRTQLERKNKTVSGMQLQAVKLTVSKSMLQQQAVAERLGRNHTQDEPQWIARSSSARTRAPRPDGSLLLDQAFKLTVSKWAE